MDLFATATRTWFEDNFRRPTEVQRLGWPVIASGRHALLTAPTGSGKTLAAFLWSIDSLFRRGERGPGVRVLYVSPLKALVYDVERNLRAPLIGVQRVAERLGETARVLRVDLRTGDTPSRDRRRQIKDPAEILVTTPESLYLLLGSQARETLRTVETVIVDEVHALLPTKRGTHLALSLERLTAVCERDPQRIGLSATVEPLDEAAGFLGGDRPVEVVDASAVPTLDLQVVVPVPDMERVPVAESGSGGSVLAELTASGQTAPPAERGIWSALYPALLERIRACNSTIVFVNSRGLCERLCQRLNELAGEELVLAHHGSVSHERRALIEDGLKRGEIRAIVATSSLELGIDMGAVDQVLQVESPGSVARGLQRIGRAGHRVGEPSLGRIYPKFRGDLLECAALAGRMRSADLEPVWMPRNPLDILAQQIAAMVAERPYRVDELFDRVRRARPYAELGRNLLEAVLDMLSGRYPSSDFADLRPLLSWDRAADTLSARKGTPMVTRLNGGTIPDRGNYAVQLAGDGPGAARLGELDEEMVFESKPGDNILLGASTWRVEQITRDRVLVSPAPGEPGRLPFWRGGGPGRSLQLGRSIGELVRRLGGMGESGARDWLARHTPLDAHAAANLARYVHEQKAHDDTLPTDRAITVERFRDELGDWRICILNPLGGRINAPWAMVLQARLARRTGFDAQILYTDDGVVLRFADVDDLPELEELLPEPDEVEELLAEQLPHTALFAGLFRENAARALLLPKRSGQGRRPLWAQRLKAQTLLAAVQRYPNFPIVLETLRQAFSEVFDLPAFKQLLEDLHSRTVRLVEVETGSASPFARSLVFAYVAAYLYEQDTPLAERRAQALTLDRGMLAELLGQAELRELLDPRVLEELEAELQQLGAESRARDADELHDLLRRVGDLGQGEIDRRCRGFEVDWLRQLRAQQRAIELSVAGEARWVAAEDAGLYRDAFGAVPPPGLPESFLAPVARSLERLLHRYAHTHGPFTGAQVAGRFGLGAAQVEPALRLLEGEGLLTRGELRPGGVEPEWCEVEVLRRLKRRTLARLRHQVEALEPAALGRFLPDWHGLGRGDGGGRAGTRDPLEVVAQLEGLPLPWSTLNEVILPARLDRYRPEQFDMLAASGALVWVGAGALGARDGKVVLYRRERVGRLLPSLDSDAGTGFDRTELHARMEAVLSRRGACFLTELEDAARADLAGVTRSDFEAALWDLVWAGRISNDTFAPLRALGGGRRAGTRHPARSASGLGGGRWSLVASLRSSTHTDTDRALARVQVLLERYGLVCREMALAEPAGGGFGPLYQVLKAMEDAGKLRRGYFVEGLSGAQFARPGLVDRLREFRLTQTDRDEPRPGSVRMLAAVDPANPYGALLPWPRCAADRQQARRAVGAWVILVNGELVLWVGTGGRSLLSFPAGYGQERAALRLALGKLRDLPLARRRSLSVQKIDGVEAGGSDLSRLLLEQGFKPDYKGLTLGPDYGPGSGSVRGSGPSG